MLKIFFIFAIFLFFLLTPTALSYEGEPEILAEGYKIEKFITGLNVPITLDFINNDILVLQKNDGQVRLIQNNILQEQYVLDLEVSNYGEQGLLGITIIDNEIYLFVSEAFHDGGLSLGNKIYQFTWNGEKLIQKKLIKSLPGWTQAYNAGVMTHDLDNNVLAVSGSQYKFGATQNMSIDQSVNCKTDQFCLDDENKITFSQSVRQTLSCINVSFYHYTTNPFGHQQMQPDLSQNIRELNPLNILTNLSSCMNAFIFDNFSNGDWKDTGVVLQVKSDNE